jgi:small subunit ribosomal protein S17
MKGKNEKINAHGRVFKGVVVSDKANKTVKVVWENKRLSSKYERYEKVKTGVQAHNLVDAKIGDKVLIKECRPLSKTKHFFVAEIIGKVGGIKK